MCARQTWRQVRITLMCPLAAFRAALTECDTSAYIAMANGETSALRACADAIRLDDPCGACSSGAAPFTLSMSIFGPELVDRCAVLCQHNACTRPGKFSAAHEPPRRSCWRRSWPASTQWQHASCGPRGNTTRPTIVYASARNIHCRLEVSAVLLRWAQ